MITTGSLKEIMSTAIKQAVLEVMPIETSPGKYHNLLSKAFVASVGKELKRFYKPPEFDHCFRDWNFEKQEGISGEWMLDVAIVRKRELNKYAKYIYEVSLALESELNPNSKAFTEDFSKLLVVNARCKVYINGVKRIKDASVYINNRMNEIRTIMRKESVADKFFICFVSHPVFWKNGTDETMINQIFITEPVGERGAIQQL